jgi:hypothetical protein
VSDAFIIGNGEMLRIEGERGATPPCPDALFKINQTVRIRRLNHLKHLPELGIVAAVVPPDFSPDWAWADLCGRPRPLLAQVGTRHISYIIAFEGDGRPLLLREKYLRPSNEPPGEVLIGDAS